MDYVSNVAASAALVTGPITDIVSSLISFIPVLIASLVMLVIGLIIAPLAGRAVCRLAELLKTDKLMDMSGAKDALANAGVQFTLSRTLGEICKYIVLIVTITICADILGLNQLSELVSQVISFIPKVIIALFIVGIGLTAAEWLQGLVVNIAEASRSKDYGKLLGNVTRVGIVVFAVMAALLEVGIAQELIMILFSGVVFAFALAFGIGAKDIVAKALDKWLKN